MLGDMARNIWLKLLGVLGFLKKSQHGGQALSAVLLLKTKADYKNAPCDLCDREFLQGRYPCSGMSLSCSDVAIEYADQTVLEKSDRIRNTDRRSLVLGR